MLDGTPLLDIKPLTSSVPAEELRRGWLAEAERRRRDNEHAGETAHD
jgi:tRNA (Thr-GGU) A37 N-methylase